MQMKYFTPSFVKLIFKEYGIVKDKQESISKSDRCDNNKDINTKANE